MRWAEAGRRHRCLLPTHRPCHLTLACCPRWCGAAGRERWAEESLHQKGPMSCHVRHWWQRRAGVNRESRIRKAAFVQPGRHQESGRHLGEHQLLIHCTHTAIGCTKLCRTDLPLMLRRRRKGEGAGRALDCPCASLAPAAVLLAAAGGNARPPAGRLLGCAGCSAAAGAACAGGGAGWAGAGSALLADGNGAGLGARGGGLGARSTCSAGWLIAAAGASTAGAVSAAAAAAGAVSTCGAA